MAQPFCQILFVAKFCRSTLVCVCEHYSCWRDSHLSACPTIGSYPNEPVRFVLLSSSETKMDAADFKRITSRRKLTTAAGTSPEGNLKPPAMLSEHSQASVLRSSTEYTGSVPPQQATSEVNFNTPSRRRNEPGESLSRRERLRQRKNYTSFNSLPKELQSNQYIVSGYRLQLGAWDSIKSVFGLHNETGNIWSHLLGQCCLLCCQERKAFGCKLHTAHVSGSERQPLAL